MNKNEGFSTVGCDFCGKKMTGGEEFVVVGKYPVFWKSLFRARLTGVGALPEDFGEIYHKDCYLKLLKKKGVRL